MEEFNALFMMFFAVVIMHLILSGFVLLLVVVSSFDYCTAWSSFHSRSKLVSLLTIYSGVRGP